LESGRPLAYGEEVFVAEMVSIPPQKQLRGPPEALVLMPMFGPLSAHLILDALTNLCLQIRVRIIYEWGSFWPNGAFKAIEKPANY